MLAINGGGDKLDNFASHLEHLRQLAALLATAGVPRDHVVVSRLTRLFVELCAGQHAAGVIPAGNKNPPVG